VAAILRQPADMEANIETFREFCSTVSDRLDELTFEEKQRILRLLNIQGRVGDGKIYLSGCVPTWGKDREKFDYSAIEPDQLP
ncbi:MAG: hypothetical protein V3V80_00565, partial [Dehalococcoidia bacterium]